MFFYDLVFQFPQYKEKEKKVLKRIKKAISTSVDLQHYNNVLNGTSVRIKTQGLVRQSRKMGALGNTRNIFS